VNRDNINLRTILRYRSREAYIITTTKVDKTNCVCRTIPRTLNKTASKFLLKKNQHKQLIIIITNFLAFVNVQKFILGEISGEIEWHTFELLTYIKAIINIE